MTQTDAIRRHLQDGKTITPIEALNFFNCFRLGARIHELRSEGMTIYSRLIKRKGKSFAEYSTKPFTLERR